MRYAVMGIVFGLDGVSAVWMHGSESKLETGYEK
jgi:VIT1/CCC1 family predicted Fe2+/Mn2+ transporter